MLRGRGDGGAPVRVGVLEHVAWSLAWAPEGLLAPLVLALPRHCPLGLCPSLLWLPSAESGVCPRCRLALALGELRTLLLPEPKLSRRSGLGVDPQLCVPALKGQWCQSNRVFNDTSFALKLSACYWRPFRGTASVPPHPHPEAA